MEAGDTMTRLLDFLDQLDVLSLYHTLSHPTPRTIMVEIAVPGERWEVEFHEDGSIDVEVFESPGRIDGPERLEELFAINGD